MDPLTWRPFVCPRGHDLRGSGAVLVGWQPCICPPAQANHNGHRTFQCTACEAEDIRMVCYLPEHTAQTE